VPKPATTQHHWTVPQALAWIAEPGNLEAASKLGGPRVGLWQLPKDRQAQQDDYGVLYICTLAGWNDLKEKLESSAIEAWGVPFDHDKHVAIPAHEWRGLDLLQERGRVAVRIGGNPRSGYEDVVLRSEDIRARWPLDKKASLAAAETR
jgi:hypothetical protein